MATGKAKESNFYATLGLKKDCSASELRKAYKKLALRWHPDRCSASGNTKYVEESKKKFQAIQEAYSVLSDSNKRFMYDIGVYDSGDDDDGMGDFLGEMVFMMSQSNQGNEQESFEDLQDLFEEMFQRDLNVFGSSSQPVSFHSMFPSSNNNNTRNCSNTNRGKVTVDTQSDFSTFEVADSLNMRTFCAGVERTDPESSDRSRRRKNGRKLKVSSNHDVSSRNAKISA